MAEDLTCEAFEAMTCRPLAREQAKTALQVMGTVCFGPIYSRRAAFCTTRKVLKPAYAAGMSEHEHVRQSDRARGWLPGALLVMHELKHLEEWLDARAAKIGTPSCD